MEIDRDFLGSALTSGGGMDCYFDRETGAVLPDDAFGTEWDEERYIKVNPLPSYVGYNFRVEFAESVEDPRLRAKLEQALQGKKGVFRRFLDIVRDHPHLEARWFAEEAKWLDERVTDWLIEQGLAPAPSDAGETPEPAASTTSLGPSEDELVERITQDPAICHGKPCVRGLRYPVETVLHWLGSGMTFDEVLADHPDLEREDLLAALLFAARLCKTGHPNPA